MLGRPRCRTAAAVIQAGISSSRHAKLTALADDARDLVHREVKAGNVHAALTVVKSVLASAAKQSPVIIEARVVDDGPQRLADLFTNPEDVTPDQELALAEVLHEQAKRYAAEHGSTEGATLADVANLGEIEAALDATTVVAPAPAPEKRPAPEQPSATPERPPKTAGYIIKPDFGPRPDWA